jgi:hypothetical protein
MPFMVCRATIAPVFVKIDVILYSFTSCRLFTAGKSHRFGGNAGFLSDATGRAGSAFPSWDAGSLMSGTS